MLKILISSVAVFGLIVILAITNITTPVTAGPFGILAVFISAYILLILTITYGLYWLSRLFGHLSMVFVARKPSNVLSVRDSYYFSTVLAAAPIMLIGLQSVGSIGLGEMILVTLFVILGCLYVSKRLS